MDSLPRIEEIFDEMETVGFGEFDGCYLDNYIRTANVPYKTLAQTLRVIAREMRNVVVCTEFSLNHVGDSAPGFDESSIPRLLYCPAKRDDYGGQQAYEDACFQFSHELCGTHPDIELSCLCMVINVSRRMRDLPLKCAERLEWYSEENLASFERIELINGDSCYDIVIIVQEEQIPNTKNRRDDCIKFLQRLFDFADRLAAGKALGPVVFLREHAPGYCLSCRRQLRSDEAERHDSDCAGVTGARIC